MYVSMYAFVRMCSCVYICVCDRVIESFCANHYLVSELPVAASHRTLLQPLFTGHHQIIGPQYLSYITNTAGPGRDLPVSLRAPTTQYG